ncbi:MAG: hypothetical protein RIR02_390, partial [Pseudomonadota bacterium]
SAPDLAQTQPANYNDAPFSVLDPKRVRLL